MQSLTTDIPSPSTSTQHPPPLPSPPFITSIPSIPNFRSITSLPTTTPPGRKTQGHIYRSADPSRLSPGHDESRFTTTLGITTIFDLRSRGELRNRTLRPLHGIENRHTPVYENKDVSPAELAKTISQYGESDGVEGFVDSYCRILEAGVKAFTGFFEFLLQRPGEGVLVHCSAGKDRTGVLVALVLKVVGVEDGDVADEYARSEQGLREWREKIVGVLVGMGDEVQVRRMLSARREVMIAWLEVLRERYGGAEGYLKTNLGFTDEEIDRIRKGIVGEE